MEWITNFFDWSNWLTAIQHPLGMAGFALFLVFLVLTRFKKGTLSRGTKTVFFSMAIVSLVGGFMLGWKKITHEENVTINATVGNVTNTAGGSVNVGVQHRKTGRSPDKKNP